MPKSPTAEFLKLALASTDLTQKEVARRIGLTAPNFLSMMKTGETKIPLNRIPEIAAACDIDASSFIRVAMAEYHPETWSILRREFAGGLTAEELELVELYRLVRDHDGKPATMTEELREAIECVLRLAVTAAEGETHNEALLRLIDDI